MKVVSNSSPLIALSRINRIHLLPELYSEVYVPAAVWQETVIQGASYPSAASIQQALWIRQMPVRNTALVLSLSQDLGAGEAEAIVLANELGADLLIVDERHARERARRFGIRFTGLLGVLLDAKGHGLVKEIKPLIQDLKETAGFHIGPDLERDVLAQAGES